MSSTTFQLDSATMKAISRLRCDDDGGDGSAQRILQIHNGVYYIWSHNDSSIVTINCATKEMVTISLTDTPNFEVEQLQVCPSGRWLCLSGSNGMTIIDLPKRSGRQGRFVGTGSGEIEISCRSFPVAQRLFMGHPKVVIQKVIWHPGTFYDNYLVVLMSDNFLRIYNVDEIESSNFRPEQIIPLSPDCAMRRDESDTKPFGNTTLSLKASIGETAVDFTFAPPTPVTSSTDDFSQDTPIFHYFPIFVLHGNGNVYCLLTGIGSHIPKSRLLGPLPMFPESSDNYGLDSCSILCLHPTISSPPILVIATNGGIIYHCVVLHQAEEDKAKEDDDVKSQASDWSSSVFGRNPDNQPDLSLYVYESVELELALTTDDNANRKKPASPFDYPILLLSDPSSPSRYFCSHKAGIHCVGLPMVAQLSEMAQNEEVSYEILTEQSSVIEHLVCTQMSPNSLPAPILGLSIAFPPSTLVFLMHDYRVETLTLTAPYFIEPTPLLSDGVGAPASPLRKNSQAGKEPFDKHIAKMLQRTTSQPIMKGATGAQLTNVECLKILTRSVKILREEYVARLENVRVELERRSAQLQSRKRQQQDNLERLSRTKGELRNNAAQLSERYEDIKDNAESLSSRIQRVLLHIQSQQPSNSDAEVRMHRQLKTLENKLTDMNHSLEQIRSKEKYQFRQIWQSQQNTIQNRLGGSPAEKNKKLGDDQLANIKSMLTQDGKDIAELVQELKIAKSCLDA